MSIEQTANSSAPPDTSALAGDSRLDTADLTITENDFIRRYVQDAPQLMWFLGAGTSRTAGMPTATDITWDLKRRYYCLHENQNLSSHDVRNQAVKNRIQAFLDSKGYPALGSPEEYAYYFLLSFGTDYVAQQKYIIDQLSPEKVSLNIGHRALAALLKLGSVRIIFTTNFDAVIEAAYAEVCGENLSAFHLEGAYAVLNALNAERFPIYAKIHGDFRYTSIMNLPQDLLDNDQEIKKAFLAASNRYGLIVSGYSGRDENIMSMFREAISQSNAFPQGLYWTTPRISDVADAVTKFIRYANEKRVHARLVETGTFDIMLSKIWRQIPQKPDALDVKVRTVRQHPVNIPMPSIGNAYPILRTNALAVIRCPTRCGAVHCTKPITFRELNDRVWEYKPDAVLTYTDKILFWGSADEVRRTLGAENVGAVGEEILERPISHIAESGVIKSFYEHALARALSYDKPLRLRLRNRTHYLVVNEEHIQDPRLQSLKNVLGFNGKPGFISGSVPQKKETFWAEAISIKLEERNSSLWVLLRPDIWIKPLSVRDEAGDFLRNRKLYRYNNKSSSLLDAWIEILFGSVGQGIDADLGCFADTDQPAGFTVNTRTAYSRRGAIDGK